MIDARVAAAAFGYRAEVDGLRAIAVIPVVLAHAGFEWFVGGYIGVDVFFVISGYLITGIILNDHRNGEFSLVHFYERRARRIIPALFLVLLSCLPFAWLWMTPHHLKGFSQSLVAVSAFSANVYYFLKSGYFDVGSEETPLLHTWSLGVEEQYYIFFPVLVILCWRWGPRTLTWLVTGTALVSFGLSDWASHAHPIGNFYLIPTRAWELALGSFLAIAAFESGSTARLDLKVRELLGVLGLALIIASVFAYDRLTRYPGLYALPPTIGAALVLANARSDTTVGKLLSMRAMVVVGMTSYSVYLWHQPLFAFARLRSPENPSPVLFAALSLLALTLGYLTWRFVERPFRDQRKFTRMQIFGAAAVGSVVFIGIGLAGHLGEGFQARFTPEQQAIMSFGDDPSTRQLGFPKAHCFLAPDQDSRAFGDCVESPSPQPVESVVLWGDSHAAHLFPGLMGKFGSNRKITHLTASACPPLLDQHLRESCRNVNEYVFARIKSEMPDQVILAAVWGHHDWQQLDGTLRGLKAAGIKQVVVVGPMPRWHPSLPVVLTRFGVAFADIPNRTLLGLDPSIRLLDARMRSFTLDRDARYVSPYTILCDRDGCLIKVDDRIESMMQWDVSHLTRIGAEYLVSRFW